ncbi:MAG: M48 family metallopeptidase, partial [Candidatus Omnitrophica bacterium]|nr:M48 family metallopeptidase [Candidatus Omnitrophota bacterium]
EDELAGVIAHEIGHAYERHPTKSLSRAYGVSTLTGLIFRNDPGQIKKIALQLGTGGLLTKYGREDEREADDISYYLLKRAGYQPDGLLRFLRKIEKYQAGGELFPFLSSHPATQERIARLADQIRTQNQLFPKDDQGTHPYLMYENDN